MIHPIPSGTRDVLPDETRELRRITDALRTVFERHGYGEVVTPALEYESEFARGDMRDARPAYRVTDENGAVLVLRSDMTVPIARVVATRYPHVEPPMRFCYFAHCYRAVRPQRGQQREMLQAGIELVGAAAPEGTVEALTVLVDALDATGLADYRIGVGDASLYPALMTSLGVPPAEAEELLQALDRRDLVALEEQVQRLGLDPAAAELLVRLPQTRGGPEILDDLEGPAEEAILGLRRVAEQVPAPVARRLIFDLGLVRDIGYYTGAIFEVYDPALGKPIGGGGRYDELLGRFGRGLPAVGFALGIDALHVALAGEERGLPRAAADTPDGGPGDRPVAPAGVGE